MFAWTYNDLKTYSTCIIQHVIPIKEGTKLFQQKLRKILPMLEPLIQKELGKLLDAQIIFKVRHSTWVYNLVPVNSDEICLCVDFHNLKQASNKDNYPVSSMEWILQIVSRSEMFSLLDVFSRYNQVLVGELDYIKINFKTKWETFAFKCMPFKLINVATTFYRAMDIMFCGLIGQIILVYLDDVTIFSKKISDNVHL